LRAEKWGGAQLGRMAHGHSLGATWAGGAPETASLAAGLPQPRQQDHWGLLLPLESSPVLEPPDSHFQTGAGQLFTGRGPGSRDAAALWEHS
jgi:hypothetical protein